MPTLTESLEFNCLFDYKELKLCKKEWLHSPLFHSSNKISTWRLQIDRSDRKKIGIYLTLINGAPCTLRSYTISITTNTNPSLVMFDSNCTQQRVFPSNEYTWGFGNFCTRHELIDEKRRIRHPKTKLINVRCIMNIEVLMATDPTDDHRLATELFHTYSLEQWIDFLKQRDDLPELCNRVNQELEVRM